MLYWAAVFLVIALIAALLGFASDRPPNHPEVTLPK